MAAQPFSDTITFTDGYTTANTPGVPVKPQCASYPSVNIMAVGTSSMKKFPGVRPVTCYPFPCTEASTPPVCPTGGTFTATVGSGSPGSPRDITFEWDIPNAASVDIVIIFPPGVIHTGGSTGTYTEEFEVGSYDCEAVASADGCPDVTLTDAFVVPGGS
jgi:hypothetical protein